MLFSNFAPETMDDVFLLFLRKKIDLDKIINDNDFFLGFGDGGAVKDQNRTGYIQLQPAIYHFNYHRYHSSFLR